MAGKVVTFKINQAAQNEVIAAIAAGLDEFAIVARDRIRALAPVGETGRYRKSIQASTWVNGVRVRGRNVRESGSDGGRGVPGHETQKRVAAGPSIRAVIYTRNPLGHLFEVTGSAAHDIPIQVPAFFGLGTRTVVLHHPGHAKQPHFQPGLLSALSELPAAMARGAAAQLKGVK